MNPISAMLMPMLLALSSSGADTTTITKIINGMSDLVSIMEQVWEVMTSNPLFVLFLGASLFSVGIWLFCRVKRAARH